ncbi:MAG: T9SS type A sorting domain-containing protein [Ignavibacteriae bacterium]|nr:T9SS C-terminal target domain-containing protein [Ignavibacteriota bacterium]NOG99512.1 T9SS type A sorting domain-containing protein [Ignavibacteriota bacterium]
MKKAIFTLLTVLLFTTSFLAQERSSTAYPLFLDGYSLDSKAGSGVTTPYMPIEAALAVYQNGADRLAALQQNDGGWDWPLDDGDPNDPSAVNTIGPIAMGLAHAYHFTGDPAHLTALSNAGALLLSKTNNFSPSDGYLAAMLDDIFGGTAYVDHVTTNFYDPLAAGTYDKNGAGTLYTTADYVLLVRTNRANQGIANLAAWDLGMGLVGAAMAGANTADWIAGVKAEIDELDGAEYYDVVGLAGAIYGLAIVGEDYDPTAGEHAAANSLADLANILASYQIDMGGFAWNSAYVIPNDDNEVIQETAYSLLALNELDRELFLDNIIGAGEFLIGVQLLTGGWENNPGSGENNEITGEALWGISVSSPELFVDVVTGNDANLGSKASPLATIQTAITGIPVAGQINVADGTYSGNLVITKSLDFIGESEAGVVINILTTGSYGITLTSGDVMLKNFTLVANTSNENYPIHASGTSNPPNGFDNLTLENITIEGTHRRTGFDIHGFNNVILTNLTSKDATGGNGVQLTGCINVVAENITTMNNVWGSLAIYSSQPAYLNRGSDNVVINGTNSSFGEGVVFNQDEFGLTNTNITVTGYEYIVRNLTFRAEAPGFTYYQIDEPTAIAQALAFPTPMDSYLMRIDNGEFVVGDGMNLNAAVDNSTAGDIINVRAGNISTNTQVVIDNNINIIGAGAGTTFINPTANTGTSGDARGWFLVNDGIELNMSELTLDGTGFLVYQGIRHLGKGTITNCDFVNIKYNESGPHYSGVAVAAFGTPAMNVDITGCNFSEIGRVGVLYFGAGITNSTFANNTYLGKGAGDWLDYCLDIGAGANVVVDNNTISNNQGVASSDGSTSAGLLVSTFYGAGSNAVITNNDIMNNTTGIAVGYDASDVSTVVANNNNIYDNTSFGVSSTAPTVDATNNWWGDASGPQHPTLNPAGTGNAVSDNVTFDPWTVQLQITAANTTYSFPSSGVEIVFTTLPVGGGTVTVDRYNSVPAGYPVPPAGATHVGLWLDITSSMPNYSFSADVTVDVTGLGFSASTSIMYFNSTTNSWVAVNNGTYAAGPPETYTFTTNHFTPFSFINTPATAYNIYLASEPNPMPLVSSVIYPNDAWGSTTYDPNDWNFTTTPIELYIVPEPGSIFGAADIVLQWDNTLFSFAGVDESGGLFDGTQFQFFYNQLGAVDQVTINASAGNSNFSTLSGDYICKLELNLLQPGFGPINFSSMDFRAFDGIGGADGVYVVGNGASVKSYLGDVASAGPDESTGDGLVNIEDLNIWASSYWSGVTGFAGGLTNYKVKYDVGPTVDNTVYTLPVPDTKIQFEDMVIFAISYGLSGDNVYPKAAPAPETPVELIVGEPMYLGSETLVPLSISGSVVDVRAMELTFGGSFGKLLSVEKGALLQNVDAPVMVMDKSTANSANVDLAIFGVDAEGLNAEGELLTLRFDGRADVQLSSANVRNSGNNSMKIEITNSNVNAIPTSFALDQNYPNPFNPSTIISYQLPEQRQVKVAIFNMLGEEVSTLVNEVKEAGYHKVEWNGANLTSGVYFYRIEAGDFVSVKKMMLMK